MRCPRASVSGLRTCRETPAQFADLIASPTARNADLGWSEHGVAKPGRNDGTAVSVRSPRRAPWRGRLDALPAVPGPGVASSEERSSRPSCQAGRCGRFLRAGSAGLRVHGMTKEASSRRSSRAGSARRSARERRRPPSRDPGSMRGTGSHKLRRRRLAPNPVVTACAAPERAHEATIGESSAGMGAAVTGRDEDAGRPGGHVTPRGEGPGCRRARWAARAWMAVAFFRRTARVG